MRKETSYGIIPLSLHGSSWEVFLVKHQKGEYWSFPKGHGETAEEPKAAAVRELKEETGLDVVRFLNVTSVSEQYQFTRDHEEIEKTVHYFLAEVNRASKLQEGEILEGKWVPVLECREYITFDESKAVCDAFTALISDIC